MCTGHVTCVVRYTQYTPQDVDSFFYSAIFDIIYIYIYIYIHIYISVLHGAVMP